MGWFGEEIVPEGSVVLVLVESDFLELNVAEYSPNRLPSFPDVLYGIFPTGICDMLYIPRKRERFNLAYHNSQHPKYS